MGMMNEERKKHIRIANMLIGVINDVNTPMLMYQIEKDVAKEALENYIKMLDQQPCEDCISIGVFEQVKWERDVAIEQLEQLGYSLGEKIRTSEDCISREQTLKAFAEKCGGECACCEYNGSGYDTAENCKLIKSMPSVTPQQTRWIPVSERLPNAYEFVNCTCHSLIDDREDWVIETAYIPQPSDSPYSDWGNIPMLNSGDCKVVAWMHRDIPEPYKAESEVNADDA